MGVQEMTEPEHRVTSRFGADTLASEVIEGISLAGKRAIVTGGASGIGIVTVATLAKAGALVTIAARNLGAAKLVADKINDEEGRAAVDVMSIELDSLDSVREFSRRWGSRPLSLLINNAGIMACPFGRTKDGFESQFGTNYLGHFLLAVLLVPSLAAGASSRVISLSSAAHKFSGIDFEDLNFERREYHPFRAYGQSKTANALFAVEFDRRYRSRGIRAFSVMPGVIRTNLGRHMTPELRAEMGFASSPTSQEPTIAYKSVEAGASTSVWAATAPELENMGGLYLEDCAQAQPFSSELPRGKGVMAYALDPEAASRLWDVSERLTNWHGPPHLD
jgi:NAD(P)-dependent dehydrogenase (short-subunit alcohol dehydrogenase family)